MQASMHVVARVIGWIILIVCCLWWVVEAQEQFAPSALQEIERVIEKYGKRPVIELIRSKKSGYITLSVGNELRKFYGPPNATYVTAQTILLDLEELRITPGELEKRLEEKRVFDQARKEASDQAKKEAEEREELTRQRTMRQRQQAEEQHRQEEAERERKNAQGALRPQETPASQPPPPLEKGNLTNWEDMCKSTGEAAKAATKARDRGATYTELLAAVRRMLANLPDPRLHEPLETVYIAMLKEICEKRWLTPERVQQDMEFACIKGISQGLSQR